MAGLSWPVLSHFPGLFLPFRVCYLLSEVHRDAYTTAQMSLNPRDLLCCPSVSPSCVVTFAVVLSACVEVDILFGK